LPNFKLYYYGLSHSSSGFAINLALFIAISSVKQVVALYISPCFSTINAKSAFVLLLKQSCKYNFFSLILSIKIFKKQQNEQLEMYDIKVKFDGESHMIEANTFINSLIHFTNVVQETNKELSSDRKVEIKIKANKEGSFEVVMALISSGILDATKTIFTDNNVVYVAALGQVVGQVYSTAKFLMGKKPKSVSAPDANNGVQITNQNGDTNYFDFRGATIYMSNPKVREAISQGFDTLERDDNVTGFEILDKQDNPLVVIEKQEFTTLSNEEYEELSKTEQNVPIKDASLNIISLDWELKKRWEFYYLGNKISCKIKDNLFADRIDKGERFGKGDTLIVDMEVRQEFDESVNTYINKSFTIIKINDHIERNVQAKMNLKTSTDGNEKE